MKTYSASPRYYAGSWGDDIRDALVEKHTAVSRRVRIMREWQARWARLRHWREP